MEKISKHDEYLQKVEKHAAYVDAENKIIGIYATITDSLKLKKVLLLKNLKHFINIKFKW